MQILGQEILRQPIALDNSNGNTNRISGNSNNNTNRTFGNENRIFGNDKYISDNSIGNEKTNSISDYSNDKINTISDSSNPPKLLLHDECDYKEKNNPLNLLLTAANIEGTKKRKEEVRLRNGRLQQLKNQKRVLIV